MQQQKALENRPGIRQAISEIKNASIEKGVAENQVLPLLSMTLSAANRGLAGNNNLTRSFGDQFSFGRGSYGFGLTYFRPVGNRVAQARLRQSRLQMQRFQAELETVIANVKLDVRNALNQVELTSREVELTKSEVRLARRELDIIAVRYRLLIDGDDVANLYLDNLLQTQQRLADAETRMFRAEAQLRQAETELQRATGVLVREEALAAIPACEI